MPVESIRIRVGPEAARAYRAVPEPDRRKIDLLLRLRLWEAMQRPEALEDVMREISQKAQERGLTEGALQNLLRDDRAGGAG